MGIWNKIKIKLVKYSLIWKFLLMPLTFIGLTSFLNHSDIIENKYYQGFIWVTDWIPSDPNGANYGKGRFFYRLSRSKFPIDKYGNYQYEVYFISDSFYQPQYYTDNNKNGILDTNEIHRCATKIDIVTLYINGKPYNNQITNTPSFWLLFKGDFENGIGDLGIRFTYNGITNPFIQWSQPKPY